MDPLDKRIPTSAEKQAFLMQKEGIERIAKAVESSVGKDVPITINVNGKPVKDVKVTSPKGEDGRDGKDGNTPKKGVDYFTPEEAAAFASEVLASVHVPKDGKDGKDAEPVDYAKLEAFIVSEVAKIPKPTNGKDGKDAIVDYASIIKTVLEKIRPEEVNYDLVKRYIQDKIDNTALGSYRTLNSGGPTTRLGELVDINVQDVETNQVLGWNGTQWVAMDQTGGGGGGTWGSITGTLSAQTDLQSALDAKGTFTLPALTAGSVLFSDGSTIAQDNASLFWDNTNNRLGIGTASPSQTLTIEGSVSGSGKVAAYIRNTHAVGYTELVFDNDTTTAGGAFVFGYGGAGTANPNQAYFYQRRNASLLFGTNNTTRMVITGGGSLVIGNTATVNTSLLEVYGAQNLVSIGQNSGTDDTDVNQLTIRTRSYVGNKTIRNIDRGSNDNFYVTDQGKVALGTYGTLAAGYALGVSNGAIDINGNQAGFQISDRTTTTDKWQHYSSGGIFRIYRLLSAVAAEPFNITASTGNVGIGHATGTSATRRLDIVDGTNNYQLRIGSTGNFTYDIGRDNSNGYFIFYGNQTGANGYIFTGINGERMRIDTSGNVMMGIAVAGAKLHTVSTTEQFRVGYDSTNYYSTTVSSAGAVTFNAVGASASFVFSDNIQAPYIGVGAAANSSTGLLVAGTGYTSNLIAATGSLSPTAGTNATLYRIAGTIVEAASGTHNLMSAMFLGITTVTGGAATVNNSAGLYIEGPMTATVAGENYAIWSDDGINRLDGEVRVGGALNHDGTTVGFYGVTPVAQSATYSATNVTTDRSYDANATSIDELADVLGTLIADLKLTGLIG